MNELTWQALTIFALVLSVLNFVAVLHWARGRRERLLKVVERDGHQHKGRGENGQQEQPGAPRPGMMTPVPQAQAQGALSKGLDVARFEVVNRPGHSWVVCQLDDENHRAHQVGELNKKVAGRLGMEPGMKFSMMPVIMGSR